MGYTLCPEKQGGRKAFVPRQEESALPLPDEYLLFTEQTVLYLLKLN